MSWIIEIDLPAEEIKEKMLSVKAARDFRKGSIVYPLIYLLCELESRKLKKKLNNHVPRYVSVSIPKC